MTEIAERLRAIRKLRGLSREQLAHACTPALTARHIARIESGETRNPRRHTVTMLADSLRVDVGALTGDRPFPEHLRSGPQPMEVGDNFAIGGKFGPILRLEFDMIRHHYGWEEKHIIALAPIMFVLLVEGCIAAWQKRRPEKLDAQQEFNPDDVLKRIPTEKDDPFSDQFYGTFNRYLRTLANELPKGTAEPFVNPQSGRPQGRICETYLDRIAGSNEARWALEYGDVRLDDIPKYLLSDKVKGERTDWLEKRLSVETKDKLREKAEKDLPVGPLSSRIP